MKDKITIVTGASSNHFQCMVNLLWSIKTFVPDVNVISYDLGLTADEAKQIPNIKKFEFSKYPAYFNINESAGRMGFRPISLQDAANEFGGIVIWLDAGCLVTGNLIELISYIKKYGVYCHRCSGKLETELHPNARTPLNVTESDLSLPLRDAGVSAFDTTNSKARALIDKWAMVALDKDATAPDGSSRKNHRQDAVFTTILHQAGFNLNTYRCINIIMRQDGIPLSEVKRRHFKYALLSTATIYKR